MMRACELLEPEYLVQMLKAVKHLSMNASLLEVLQNANAIEILVRILEEHSSGPHITVSTFLEQSIIYILTSKPTGNIKSYLPNLLQLVPTQ